MSHSYTATTLRDRKNVPKCHWTLITDQELLLTRLAMGIVEREDDDVTMEKLDKALRELLNKKVTKLTYVVLVYS